MRQSQTAIVGLRCKDGVVIGTDSSTTLTTTITPTVEQITEKLEVIAERVIVAGTGSVGLGQRFCEVVDVAYKGSKVFHGSGMSIAKALAILARQDFASTGVKEGQYGALVAFPSADKFHLCEFQQSDLQPELKTEKLWYASLGCTQPITDSFLALIREIFWTDGLPSVQQGIFATTWTLDHAIQVNPGGVNGPVKIAVLQNEPGKGLKARMLDEKELLEHRQNIQEAKSKLREFYAAVGGTTGASLSVPDVPKLITTPVPHAAVSPPAVSAK